MRRDGSYWVVERPAFTARFLIGDDDPGSTENGDALISVPGGPTRYLTFLTTAEIERVLARHRSSGETAGGAYFYSTDLVVVPRPGLPAVVTAVAELVRSGDIEVACQIVDEDG